MRRGRRRTTDGWLARPVAGSTRVHSHSTVVVECLVVVVVVLVTVHWHHSWRHFPLISLQNGTPEAADADADAAVARVAKQQRMKAVMAL